MFQELITYSNILTLYQHDIIIYLLYFTLFCLLPFYLQLVNQPFLDSILCSSIGGHAETLSSLSQLLLLLFTVRVCCCSLR